MEAYYLWKHELTGNVIEGNQTGKTVSQFAVTIEC